MTSVVSPVVRDPARLAALRSLGLLDTGPEPAFERLSRLAAKILKVPVVLVSLVDEDRQFFKSCLGLPEPWSSARETPLSHSFCQHTVATAEPLVINDARRDPRVSENLAIRDLSVIAYAGIPLVTDDGFTLGSLCAIDTQPRDWTTDEISILSDLAASVMTEIRLRTDIVEDHRREAALQTSYAEVQAALALRDRFLSIAAHDLNSPIAALVGYADLLKKRMEQTGEMALAEQRMLQTIGTQARHLSEMILSLLDFSQIEHGQLMLEQKDVELGKVIRRIAERMQVIHEGHTLMSIVPAVPLVVRGDEMRLEEALQNLVQNAFKYSPTGSTVTVAVAQRDALAVITVTDQGIGIEPQVLPRLFDEFYRAGNAQGQPGLGLGLYVVKQIVTMHGGAIEVHSEVGQGSTFTLSLPLASQVRV